MKKAGGLPPKGWAKWMTERAKTGPGSKKREEFRCQEVAVKAGRRGIILSFFFSTGPLTVGRLWP